MNAGDVIPIKNRMRLDMELAERKEWLSGINWNCSPVQ
jgi:hypothetical protein